MRKLKFLPSVSRVVTLGLLAISAGVNAQNTFTNVAGEYGIIGPRPGDQTHAHAQFDTAGGWIVWQDNAIDGAGLGIGGRRLDSNLSGDLAIFRINEQADGEQERPRAALLSNGGAAVVWQGGRPGFQKVYARFIGASGVFASGDVMVNSYTNQHQIHPEVASLANGNVVVVWSSFGQDGSMLGVYGQLLSSTGAKIGSEFPVNQSTNLNQRTPSIAALPNGKFVVVWTSEKPRQPDANDARNYDSQVMARSFDQAGGPTGDEFAVNSGSALCSNPSIASTADGFVVAWARKDTIIVTNSMDIYARAFTLAGAPKAAEARVNSTAIGDQYNPVVAASGTNCFVAWTSLGQDSSYEGVYGRQVTANGAPLDSEVLVNTTTQNRQIQPSVAADSNGRFLVTWSSFVGAGFNLDIYAQRYGSGAIGDLPPPSIPYVSALSSTALSVTWPALAGYSVDFYELYIDGSATPVAVTGIRHTVTNLAPSSSHTFRLAYQLTNGDRSPQSGQASGTTWGLDGNNDNLPDDWQAGLWGANPADWPASNVDSDGDGASNLAEFLAGTDPKDAGSVLRTRMQRTGPAVVFSWNTQPGLIYQVERSTVLGAWENVGLPRFAHGISDSLTLPNSGQSSFYRVIRLR